MLAKLIGQKHYIHNNILSTYCNCERRLILHERRKENGGPYAYCHIMRHAWFAYLSLYVWADKRKSSKGFFSFLRQCRISKCLFIDKIAKRHLIPSLWNIADRQSIKYCPNDISGILLQRHLTLIMQCYYIIRNCRALNSTSILLQ